MGDADDEGPRLVSDAPEALFEAVITEVARDHGLTGRGECEVYLMTMLVENAASPARIGQAEEPFAIRLAQAMNDPLGDRFNQLRTLGDELLFLSGFFEEHLVRRGLSSSYVIGVGQMAYGGAASSLGVGQAAAVLLFDELARKFPLCVRLLRDVADSLRGRSANSGRRVLELYQRWAETGSPVLARSLAERGLHPSKGSQELN